MFNTSLPNLMAATLLVIATSGFAWGVNWVGKYTVPHSFTIQFQGDKSFASMRDVADLLYDVETLRNGNSDYRIEIFSTQNPDLPPGVGGHWASELQRELVRRGIPIDEVVVIDQGSENLPARDDHETMALWKKRVNQITIMVSLPEETN